MSGLTDTTNSSIWLSLLLSSVSSRSRITRDRRTKERRACFYQKRLWVEEVAKQSLSQGNSPAIPAASVVRSSCRKAVRQDTVSANCKIVSYLVNYILNRGGRL